MATIEHQLIPGFRPETGLERRLLRDPELRRGWAWGQPRDGHPEGAVGNHVGAMLRAIRDDDPHRADLRLLTLLHDTFKRCRGRDHALVAREFAERHGCPQAIAQTVALHDSPYWVWHRRGGDPVLLEQILAQAPDRALLVHFVRLDAATHGKDQRFLRWFDAHTAGE
jgi:hypothetical protein